MNWLKSKTMIVVACFVFVVGLQAYGLVSVRSTLNDRITSLEEENAKADERVADLSSNLDVVAEKVDVTEQELMDAQDMAKQLRRENAQLRRVINTKADSKSVLDFQKDAATKISSVHQDTTSRIEGVSGDVKVVRTDLDATRNDLNATRSDLKSTRSDLDATRSDLKLTRDDVANSRRDLSALIAKNSTELAELRRKGERDYVEFDLVKGNQFKRVGDVMLQLKKTDMKKQKYEVVVNADDQAMQKKDRMANEPVSFVVGRDRLHYELVVNYVGKDMIRGYISSPKEKGKKADQL